MWIPVKFKIVVYIINRQVASFFEGGVDRQLEIKRSNHTLMINRKEKYFMAGCYVHFSYNVGLGKIKELANIENKHSTKS